MKKRYPLIASLLLPVMLSAQTPADLAVQLSATVQETPPQIRLTWKKHTDATSYAVYRRLKGSTNWGSPLATMSGADTVYTDNSVSATSAYEYRVAKDGGSLTALGYIYAGINAPPIHNRGTLLLVVDNLFIDSCAAEIAQLMEDISGDGWQLLRRDVSRDSSDVFVKSLIRSAAQTHSDLSAVLLLGHVAVPYSGDLNPDGHGDHKGAWPADGYYGDLQGVWTDNIVNDTTAAQTRNHNVPGDGKWDQSIMPFSLALQVSRVDFHNMPAFGKTEVQLMKNYLNRLHRYKMDSVQVQRRALVDNNFSLADYSEGFSLNAWRNFPPLVGADQIHQVDFVESLDDSSFQWAYGCGAGFFNSAGGIGNTTSFTTHHVNGIFTMLFGSYFGDWDSQNNFLRAPLCAETPALTSCWAGRPHWYFHHMALGENIGYSARLSQNNTGAANAHYDAGIGARFIHIALMGDLTLRTEYIRPASGLTITPQGDQGATLSWSPSPDAGVVGYYVYRSDELFGKYEPVSSLVTGTTYSDQVGTDGLKYYMVRPVKKVLTPSGTYFNLGIGIRDSATVDFPDPIGIASSADPALELTLFPNPASAMLHLAADSRMAADAQIRITDIQGRMVEVHQRSLPKGTSILSLPVGHLPEGWYVLRLNAGDQVVVRKFLKQ